jgi:hypothetical protein
LVKSGEVTRRGIYPAGSDSRNGGAASGSIAPVTEPAENAEDPLRPRRRRDGARSLVPLWIANAAAVNVVGATSGWGCLRTPSTRCNLFAAALLVLLPALWPSWRRVAAQYWRPGVGGVVRCAWFGALSTIGIAAATSLLAIWIVVPTGLLLVSAIQYAGMHGAVALALLELLALPLLRAIVREWSWLAIVRRLVIAVACVPPTIAWLLLAASMWGMPTAWALGNDRERLEVRSLAHGWGEFVVVRRTVVLSESVEVESVAPLLPGLLSFHRRIAASHRASDAALELEADALRITFDAGQPDEHVVRYRLR